MKTVVITGATSGIGLAAAKALAHRGYRIIGVGRSQARCDAAQQKLIHETGNADITYVCGDLSRQADVHRVADGIAAALNEHSGGGLSALINNAGGVRSWYETTPEGYETAVRAQSPGGVFADVSPDAAAAGRGRPGDHDGQRIAPVYEDALGRHHVSETVQLPDGLQAVQTGGYAVCRRIEPAVCRQRHTCVCRRSGTCAHEHRLQTDGRHRQMVLGGAQPAWRCAGNTGRDVCVSVRRTARTGRLVLLSMQYAAL